MLKILHEMWLRGYFYPSFVYLIKNKKIMKVMKIEIKLRRTVKLIEKFHFLLLSKRLKVRSKPFSILYMIKQSSNITFTIPQET